MMSSPAEENGFQRVSSPEENSDTVRILSPNGNGGEIFQILLPQENSDIVPESDIQVILQSMHILNIVHLS